MNIFLRPRVYGQVPDESAVKPCFHVYELANRSIRDISGDKAGSNAVWRLVTYVKDESTLPDIPVLIVTGKRCIVS